VAVAAVRCPGRTPTVEEIDGALFDLSDLFRSLRAMYVDLLDRDPAAVADRLERLPPQEDADAPLVVGP